MTCPICPTNSGPTGISPPCTTTFYNGAPRVYEHRHHRGRAGNRDIGRWPMNCLPVSYEARFLNPAALLASARLAGKGRPGKRATLARAQKPFLTAEEYMRSRLNLNRPKMAGSMLAGILAVALPMILGITNAPELRAQAQSAPRMMAADADPRF